MKHGAAVRPQAKPSRLYGTKVWCVDGPLDARQIEYRGRRFNNRVGDAMGEYRHDSRPLGNRQGHEVYYQWFGPPMQTVVQGKAVA